MRAIDRRLRRLERHFGPEFESSEMCALQVRLEAARLRCGLLPPTPERLTKLKGMSVVQILNEGRERARNRER
jgi:hypothetical protein